MTHQSSPDQCQRPSRFMVSVPQRPVRYAAGTVPFSAGRAGQDLKPDYRLVILTSIPTFLSVLALMTGLAVQL